MVEGVGSRRERRPISRPSAPVLSPVCSGPLARLLRSSRPSAPVLSPVCSGPLARLRERVRERVCGRELERGSAGGRGPSGPLARLRERVRERVCSGPPLLNPPPQTERRPEQTGEEANPPPQVLSPVCGRELERGSAPVPPSSILPADGRGGRSPPPQSSPADGRGGQSRLPVLSPSHSLSCLQGRARDGGRGRAREGGGGELERGAGES